jgi:4-hydroxybenzoyl-CoA reductase subunit beta
MLLPAHQFEKPATLTACLDVLAESAAKTKIAAGGTDVTFNMRGKLFQPDILLSIRDLPELKGVELLDDGSLRIGAGNRLSDLERDPLITDHLPGLIPALRAVASRHVRNMATLGGNLCLDTRCWYTNQTAEWREAKGGCLKTGVSACHAIKSSAICVALNASDTAPMLIALDATVTLESANGSRQIPLDEFYTDDGIHHTVRQPDEIMTAVTVPACHSRTLYLKETARKGNDFSYGVVAAVADGSGSQTAHLRLVLGSFITRPLLLSEPSKIIVEQGMHDAAIKQAMEATRAELGNLTNLYTPAIYKSRLGRTLVRLALEGLREVAA